MKAVIYQKYGSPDVLQIADVPKPIPKDNEVLIKVHAASINAYDWHLMRALPFFTRFTSGLFKPRNEILGADIAGVVELAGKSATLFKPGDEVYGCLESCGKGGLAAGGFAEYVCAKETVLAPKPLGIAFTEAAALPMAAVTALQGLRDIGKIMQGHKVLINGASGGVGTFGVQIAKAFGAEVTGVCNTRNLAMVHSIGADTTIDYSRDDFSKHGRRFDLILNVAANHTLLDYRRILNPNGVCVLVGFSSLRYSLNTMLFGSKGDRKIVQLMANNKNKSDLVYLNQLLESGKVKPVIDGCYSLDEISKAFWYFEKEHARGKVVISVTS
jgi:NADPH:quinone reductase-like Zn-dependent oxidoreductase